MAIDPMHSLRLDAGPSGEVTHLGVVADEFVAHSVHDEIEELRARLDTERGAGRALLAAIGELESRLNAERATCQALLTTVRELDGALEGERAELCFQRETNDRIWSHVTDLHGALMLAERPLWRKLLRRA